MMELINTYGLPILGVVMVAVFGMAGRFIFRAGRIWLDTQAKQEYARLAVRYVEQIFTDMHGQDKFKQALSACCKWLNAKHIKWTEAELTVIIEAAVEEMNEYLKPPLLAMDTAEEIRVPEEQ